MPNNLSDQYNKLTLSPRINKIPLYVFAEIAEAKAQINPEILIDLSLGSPDSRTPDPILNELSNASQRVNNHGYPRFNGKQQLNLEIVNWIQNRFKINLTEEQVLPLLGSKEGLAHLPLVYLDKGDISLIPNPHYPVHYRGSIIAGAEVYDMPLKQSNSFLPDLEAIPDSIANKAKFMIISYPNNPTGAVATESFMHDLVKFCRKWGIMLCHDLAYSELGFDDHKPKSIFEYMDLEEPAIEFFTFSKTYHMAGWRIGFCIGNQSIVQNLYKLKTNMDYGVSGAIQDAAIRALQMPLDYSHNTAQLYQNRAHTLHSQLTSNSNWDIFKPQGAMYLWIPVPPQFKNGQEFSLDLLTKHGICTTPGIAFGSEGDQYIRIALVQPEDKLLEAGNRIIQNYV